MKNLTDLVEKDITWQLDKGQGIAGKFLLFRNTDEKKPYDDKEESFGFSMT